MGNKQDHEEFINIILSTPVDTVISDCGSVETPFELCETPSSYHSESRRKELKK